MNRFPGADTFPDDEVRDALALRADTPIVRVDARSSTSCTAALIVLVEHALARSGGGTRRTAPARAGSLAAHSYLS